MKILITGSSGFIGQCLSSYLRNKGHSIKTLVRRASKDKSEITGNPERFEIPDTALNDVDAVINLSGRNIADKLWSAKFKQELYESRIKPTRTLARAISKITDRQLTFISTSGVGIYGAKTHGIVDESSPPAMGFFAGLAEAWENEALTIKNKHRVVITRFGVVLGKDGGLIKKVAPIFKLGLGARLGNGNNLIPWIAIEDLCRAIELILQTPTLSGPINVVNPFQVTSDNFYSDIAEAFGRKVYFRIPKFLLQAVLGEFGDETILTNQQVLPKKLLDSVFSFHIKSPREAALNHC